LYQCLAANDLLEICGILNGTTNYILTRMIREGLAYEDALKEAQEKGYAESDPSADIEGKDACRKICILAALAFGRHIYPSQVETEGITGVTAVDVAAAEMAGKRAIHSVNVRSAMPMFAAICMFVRPSLAQPCNRVKPSSVNHSSNLPFLPIVTAPHATAKQIGQNTLCCNCSTQCMFCSLRGKCGLQNGFRTAGTRRCIRMGQSDAQCTSAHGTRRLATSGQTAGTTPLGLFLQSIR
jgi:hypothetical protein